MISLVPSGQFGDAAPATAPAAQPSPTIQKIQVQAIGARDALILGIVSGFALALGNLIFDKLAKRLHWK